MRSVQPDLTAAATIRDVAMGLFAARGVRSVTVREIAAAAGVSAPLVIHHYGTKAGLKERVDEHAMALLSDMFALSTDAELDNESVASMTTVFADLLEQHPQLTPYLRRLLIDGGPEAQALFAGLYEATVTALEQMRRRGLIRGGADEPVQAAFLLVNDLGAVILRDQILTTTGVDPLGRPGILRWGDTVMDVYSHGLLSPTTEEP